MPTTTAYDAKRRAEKRWRNWYKTARWAQIRSAVLARDPVCRLCRTAQATICDHRERHNGDPIRFWRGPFQGLCKPCHDSAKQSWESVNKTIIGPDGWPAKTGRPRGWIERDDLFLPKDLRPSRPRLTIVAGPPASGKSTYVTEHAGPNDLLIDSDIEAKRLGIPRYTTNWADRVRLLKARNDRLRELAQSRAPAAWFTALLAKPEDRAHFAELLQPANVIVLATPADECVRRIKASRPDAPEDMLSGPYRWHAKFCRREGEIVRQS